MTARPVKVTVAAMIATAVLAVLVGVAHVGRRQEIIRLGYELAKATEELAKQQEENRRLRLEKSTLTSPDRIERLAESLGMVQPRPEQIRVVRRGDKVAFR